MFNKKMFKSIFGVYLFTSLLNLKLVNGCNKAKKQGKVAMELSNIYMRNTNETTVELTFVAFGLNFDIVLKRILPLEIVSESNIVIHDKFGRSKESPWFQRYKGFMINDQYNSSIFAIIYDHLLYARIINKDSVYEVEQIDKTNNFANVYKTLFKNFSHEFSLNSLDRQNHSSVCSLKIAVDYPTELYHLKDTIALLNEIETSIDIVDGIFTNSDFNGDQIADRIGFSLSSLEVYEAGRLFNTSLNNSVNSEEFLNSVKCIVNYDDDCAGIVFTYRQISEHNLLKTSICAPHYNVILIPIISRNTEKLSMLYETPKIAHHLGRLFGSEEDKLTKNPECFNKSYIMSSLFDESVQNYRFSPCSLQSIGKHLRLNGGCLISNGIDSDWLTPDTDSPITLSTPAFHQTPQYKEYSDEF